MAVEQLTVRNVSDRIGLEGQVVSPPHMNDERNYPITEGRAKQVLDVDVAGGGSGDQTVTVFGEPVTISATGTQGTDVTALKDAINANPIARGIYTATESGGTKVVLTANEYFVDGSISGAEPDITVSGDALTLSEDTAASDATQLKVARAVYFDGSGGITTTNPNSDNLDALAGFTMLRYDAEQSTTGANDTSLYEDQEDAMVSRTGRMVVAQGDSASEGDEVWIEQAAGDDLGKVYASSGSSSSTLVITPTANNDEDYVIQLDIDGEVVYVSYTSDGSATAQEIVEGLKAELDDDTQATLLAATEDDSDLTITFADDDADVSYVLSDNLSGVRDDGTTRLKLDPSRGKWHGPNKIEYRLAL